MRKSEIIKLKALMDMGKSKEEILEAMKPKRGNGDKQKPEGGISLSAAKRKYNIAHQTLSRWAEKGYIPVLLRTKKELYLDENALAELAEIYNKNPGRGKRTVKQLIAIN